MTQAQREEVQAKEELGIIPDSSEVFGKRAATFDKMIEERTQLKAVMHSLEEELGYTDSTGKRHPGLDDRIQEYLADTGIKTVMSNGIKVTQAQGTNVQLKKDLLVEAGVAATVIADCTVRKNYDYLLITPPKAQKK